MQLPYKCQKQVQKILNRRINSCRASIACSGFIRLSIFSRRSRSIAARPRTSWLRAFHFAYLAEPMPSARNAEMIQTVMSVAVTRSIEKQRQPKRLLFRSKFKLQPQTRWCCKTQIVLRTDLRSCLSVGPPLPFQGRGEGEG